MSFILIIDTSTERGVVALAREGVAHRVVALSGGVQSSQQLVPALLQVLDVAQVGGVQAALEGVKAIAVAQGPGAYTGIRVGVAFAKGLAYPRKIPLIGLCSLSGFVAGCKGEFLSVIDARSGGAYVLRQAWTPKGIVALDIPRQFALEEVGPYAASALELVGPRMERFTHFGLATSCGPCPHHLASLAEKKYTQGEGSCDLPCHFGVQLHPLPFNGLSIER